MKPFILFQILLENERAVDVRVLHNDTIRRVNARKEVILSAGSVASPKLLMLSGIGPRKHLESIQVCKLIFLSCLKRLRLF